jgi:hypothetical protein
VDSNPNDESFKIFELRSTDPDFGESWSERSNAVNQGALFYDGDDNGIYESVDKNNNGVWDPDKDKPDLLGDYSVK